MKSLFDFFLKLPNLNIVHTMKVGIICVAILSCSIQVFSQSYDSYVKLGDTKRFKKDYLNALADYNKAIALNQNRAEAYFGRGTIKNIKNDLEGAIEDFKKGIKIKPSSENYYILSLYQEKVEDYHNALFSINKSIELNNESSDTSMLKDIYNVRARLRMQLNDYRASLADYNFIIKLDPNGAYYFLKRAEVKIHLSDYRGALADYDQCLKLKPLTDDGKTSYWFLKYEERALNGQLNTLNKLIIQNSKDSDLYFKRGRVKSNLKDYIGSIHDYSLAIEIFPDENAYLNRGIVKDVSGDYRGAISDYNKVISINHENADAFFLRGISKYDLQDYKGAIDDLSTSITMSTRASAYEIRGLAKIKIRDINDGCLDLSKAGELGSTTAYKEIQRYCK